VDRGTERWTFAYDAFRGQLEQVTDPDGTVVRHERDLAGNRTRLWIRDAGGVTTSDVRFAFDHLNRLVSVIDATDDPNPGDGPDGPTWTHEWDAVGNTGSKPIHARRSPMKKSMGIDLGMDSSAVAVVGGAARLVAADTLPMHRDAIRRQRAGYAGCRVVLEVGSDSPWVSRELHRLGLDVRCVNARRLRMLAGSTLKTDELDAEVLARLARISVMDPSLLPAVHHRSEQT